MKCKCPLRKCPTPRRCSVILLQNTTHRHRSTWSTCLKVEEVPEVRCQRRSKNSSQTLCEETTVGKGGGEKCRSLIEPPLCPGSVISKTFCRGLFICASKTAKQATKILKCRPGLESDNRVAYLDYDYSWTDSVSAGVSGGWCLCMV